MKKIICGLILGFVISGCAHQPVENFSFRDRPLFTSSPQTKDYKEIGKVSASKSGFIWQSCNMLADSAAERLLYEAKYMGGNAVANVYISDCTTQYGWFALYILPGFGPWVRHVEISGTAIMQEDFLPVKILSPSNKVAP